MENTDEACKDAKEILLSQLTTRKGSKETDSPQSSKAVVQMCKVCENVPGIPIYRSIACGSCRIFFLRHSIPQKRMLCKFDNNCCHKSSKAQVRCVACRYKKCLSAGLQPLLAGRRKHCRRKANDSAKDSPGKASSTTDEDSNELVEQHTQNIVRNCEISAEVCPSPFRVETVEDRQITVESLLELEKFCLQDDFSTPLDLNFDLNINISFDQLLINPTMVCPRVPAGFDRFPPVTEEVPKDFLARCFVRGMLQLTDWLRATPELWMLEEKDRKTFGSSRYLVVSLLQAFYYSFKNKLNGVTAGFNTDVHLESNMFPELGEYYAGLAAYVHEIVFPLFESIDLQMEEYLLFKNIVIFTPVVGVSDSGAEIIRKARKKYEQALVERLKSQTGSSNVVQSISLLMDVQKILMSIAQRGEALASSCCVYKTGGLCGRLAADVFFQ